MSTPAVKAPVAKPAAAKLATAAAVKPAAAAPVKPAATTVAVKPAAAVKPATTAKAVAVKAAVAKPAAVEAKAEPVAKVTKAAPKAKTVAKVVPAKAAAAKPAAKAKAKAKPAAVVEEAENGVEPVADEGEERDEKGKKSRIQLAAVLGVGISPARCATHLKQRLGDAAVEAKIAELRKELKVAKESDDKVEIARISAIITTESKSLTRMSGNTSVAVASLMDSMIKELLRHGMSQAVISDRKIVDVIHLHDGEDGEEDGEEPKSPSSLVYYPLFAKCTVWSGYDPAVEIQLKTERAAANKVAKEAREAKKEASATPPAKGGRVAKVVADDDEEQHTKTTFCTYVESALKTVKSENAFANMRVSNRVREYLSDLVIECIALLAKLAEKIVKQVVEVRTMNTDHILAVVDLLLTYEGRSEDQIESVKNLVREKLNINSDHIQAEKSKKAASLDDDAKVELTNKRLEADLARKLKQSELAKKRAIDAAKKARELDAETNKLAPVVKANKLMAEAKAEAAAEAEAKVASDVEADPEPNGVHDQAATIHVDPAEVPAAIALDAESQRAVPAAA